jgi:hypothetical protein
VGESSKVPEWDTMSPVPARHARAATFTLGEIEPLIGIPHRTLSHASDRGERLAGYGLRRANLVTIGALVATG